MFTHSPYWHTSVTLTPPKPHSHPGHGTNVTPPTRVRTRSPSGSRTRDSGAGGGRSNKERQRLQPLASVARAPLLRSGEWGLHTALTGIHPLQRQWVKRGSEVCGLIVPPPLKVVALTQKWMQSGQVHFTNEISHVYSSMKHKHTHTTAARMYTPNTKTHINTTSYQINFRSSAV